MRLLKKSEGSTWHVEVTSESGKKHTIDLCTKSREEALKLVAAAKVEDLEQAARVTRLTAEVVSLITSDKTVDLKEATEKYIAWAERANMSQKTTANTKRLLRAWMGKIGNKPISAITPQDINDWVNPDDAIKAGTRKMRLASIKALCKWAMSERIIVKDPSATAIVNLRGLSHVQKEVEHKVVLDDATVDYAIAKASGNPEPPSITPGFFRAALIIGRDMALRIGDICNLEWDSFDFERQRLIVWTSKGLSRVELPMTKRVLKLAAEWKHGDDKFMFPNEREISNDQNKRAMLSVYFKRFLESIGIEDGSFHSLRATYATVMANRGMSVEEIATALGHKSTEVTKVYVRKPDAAKVTSR